MPLLKKCDDPKKAEWVALVQTRKQVTKHDNCVLGHTEIRMPAIVSSSNLKGVKGRLVSSKPSVGNKPPSSNTTTVNVLHEWTFDEDDQTRPIHLTPPITINTDFWIEMCNPNKQDAVVNATIHCLYMSKNI